MYAGNFIVTTLNLSCKNKDDLCKNKNERKFLTHVQLLNYSNNHSLGQIFKISRKTLFVRNIVTG